MAERLLSILIALLAFAGLAVGLMFKRGPIKGSCCRMGAMPGGEGCAVYGGIEANALDKAPRSSPTEA